MLEHSRAARLDIERTIQLDAELTAPLAPVAPPTTAPLPRLDLGEGCDAELRIEGLLARGGMGQVQLVRQRSLDREVAVKRLLPDRSSAFSARSLLVEGLLTGKLEHPSIVPVHMLGLDELGDPVVVMKRIEGVPWSALIDDAQHPAWCGVRTLSEHPLYRHLEILLQVCSPIRFAHARGVVHRDIKPSNVMIGSFGEIYVLDWGLAASRRTAAFAHVAAGDATVPLGTPGYMAPEMLEAEGVLDERTDVYQLTATIHRALTGRPRHDADDILEAFQSALRSEPFAYGPEIPATLAAICNRGMARKPQDRYQSVDELASAVAEFLRHQGSMRLAAEAAARFHELEAVLRMPDALAEAQKLFSESRFGFQQALREWLGNTQARDGLRRAIELMVRAMIARDNLETARALAAELHEPVPELAAAMAAASERRAAEREQISCLRQLAHEVDSDLGKLPRALLIGAAGVSGAGIAAALLVSTEVPSHALGFGVLAGYVGAVTLLVLVGRRHLLVNAANRRMVTILYVNFAALFAHRLMGWSTQSAWSSILPVDLLICAATFGAAAVGIDRRIALHAVFFAGGALLAHLMPGNAIFVTNATVVVAATLGSLGWVAPRSVRESAQRLSATFSR